MAYPHHDVHEHSSTYVEERDGVSAVLIAIGVILLVALLVWLFAFSGVVFDGNSNDGTTQIRQEQTTTDDGTNTGGGGGTTEQQPTTQPTSS